MISSFSDKRFNKSFVTKESGAAVEIEEKAATGSGIISFPLAGDKIAIRIPNGKPPLSWASNGKCADGAIILQKDEVIEAHIIELKGSVGPGAWQNIKKQFHGMYINILAVTSVGCIPSPKNIVCHIAYKKDTFKGANNTDPTLIKTVTGGATPIGGGTEWNSGSFQLEDFGQVELRKIQRSSTDGTGTGTI